jgi:hypothetical protein
MPCGRCSSPCTSASEANENTVHYNNAGFLLGCGGASKGSAGYATRQDGSYYGTHLEKVFQQRREAALKAMDDAGRQRPS